MRPVTLAITVLLFLPVLPHAGSSECDPTPSLEVASQKAGVVFIGRTRTVSPTSNDVTFDVDWQWKGHPIPAVVTVGVSGPTELATSAASRTFATDRKYMVFTTNSFEPFVVDACGAHQPFAADGSVIPPNLWEALGNSEPIQPGPIGVVTVTGPPPSWTSMGAVAIGAVILMMLVRSLFKRREQRKNAGPKPFKMGRATKEWLAEQEKLEHAKPTFGDRKLEKQRKVWARQRKKRLKPATAATPAVKRRASADS